MEFDFSQNTSVADINKIPQDFRGLYTQKDDKFVLDAENAGVKSAISAITGLNTALKAARAEAKNKTTIDLTPLKEYGDTPEAIKTKISEVVEGLQGQIKGVNVEKIKQDLATEYSGKLTSAEKAKVEAEDQLYAELAESRATSAIAEEKGNVELLMPFVLKQLKRIKGEDGKHRVAVVDGAADIRYSGVSGAPMTIKELVAEMKTNEKFGMLFSSEAPKGGGTEPGATSRKHTTRVQTGEMTAMQKIAAGLAKKR